MERPPSFAYEPYDDISYCAFVTAKLREIGIPCVLWGSCLIQLWGEDPDPDDRSFEFIVPDGSLDKASQLLSTLTGLIPCPGDEKECRQAEPLPSFHLHVRDEDENWRRFIAPHVRLYKQSETIWFLPPIEETLGPCQYQPDRKLPEQFIRGSDNLLPNPSRLQSLSEFRSRTFFTGRLPSPEGDVVVALQAHVMLEAFIRCHLRDDMQYSVYPPGFPISLLCHRLDLARKVQAEDHIDPKKLPPVFQRYWTEFCCHGRDYNGGKSLDELRREMGMPPVDRSTCPDHLKGLCQTQ